MTFCLFFFKQKTAYEMRISDWSSDVCSSDLVASRRLCGQAHAQLRMHGGMNDDAAAGAHRRDQRIADLLHARVVDHADADLLTGGAKLGNARGAARWRVRVRLQRPGPACPPRQRITGIDPRSEEPTAELQT